MFTRKKEPSQLDLAYDRVVRDLRSYGVLTKEYAETLVIVERLNEMRNDQKSPSISADTKATVAGNLLGILMIIKHEHVNVITSKAMSLVLRPKI